MSESIAGAQSLSKHSSTTSQLSINIRRARRATQEGQYNKAIKSLTSDGLATPSVPVLQEMLSKHPQSVPPPFPSGLVPSPFTVSESVVRKGVKSFPTGSSPGPSGLHLSHLREAVGCPSPDQAYHILGALTRFVNCLASGRAPPTVTPHLCGATLLASKKPNGGHRPIVVGEVLCRLVSKCLATLVHRQSLALLCPLQLGVGVKGGSEALSTPNIA